MKWQLAGRVVPHIQRADGSRPHGDAQPPRSADALEQVFADRRVTLDGRARGLTRARLGFGLLAFIILHQTDRHPLAREKTLAFCDRVASKKRHTIGLKC